MNDFIVQLMAKLDTSKTPDDIKKLEQQLNAKGIEIKPILNTATAKQEIQNLAKQLSSILSSQGLEIDTSKIVSSINQVINEINSITSKANKIQLSVTDEAYVSKMTSAIENTKKWTDETGNARIATVALKSSMDSLALASEAYGKHGSVENAQKLTNAYQIFDDELKSVNNSIRTMNSTYAKDSTINSLHQKVQEFYDKNAKAHKTYGTQLKEMLSQTSSGATVTNEQMRKLEAEFINIGNAARQTGKLGNTFFGTIKENVKSFVPWITGTGMIMRGIQSVKNMVDSVKDLDDALVDLKKTTSMTASQLEDFYYSSNDVAKQMGVTTAEIINQASAWSRLGYSTAETATQMAKLSSQFASISPGMNVEQATDGLVSIMKAFDIDPNKVLDGVMSKINIIGNTAATSNSEIVTMLQKSSSAMKEANNTLEETIALETAAVEITRDANSVGNAYKTVAMRIRGYDEEAEAYINDVEQLSGTIANLTKTASTPGGISLFTDSSKTEYKSTYQLLKDISEIYDELTDKEQAGLLEALAGKRQGQIIAATIGNFEAVQKALDDMSNSAGSADKEMSVIMDSINYKANKTKEITVGIGQNLFKREDMKTVLDGFNSILSVVDKLTEELGLFGTVGLAGIVFGTKKSGVFDVSSIKEMIRYQQALATANGIQLTSWQALKAGIISSTKALGKWFITNPVGWAIIGTTAVIGLAKAYDALTDSTEEVKERTDKLLLAYKSALNEATSNAQTVEGLVEKYKTLSNGVNGLGENISLTKDEFSEYHSICNQIADMFPTLISGYDSEGNAILNLKDNVELLRDAYKNAQQEAYNMLIISGKNGDGNDIIKNYQNQVGGKESSLSKTSSFFDGEGGAIDAIDIITQLTGTLTPEEFKETYDRLYNEYENIWNSKKIKDAFKSSGIDNLSHNWANITSDDLANIKKSAQITIQTYQTEIDTALSDIKTLANAYLMTNDRYANIDDTQLKNIISIMVNSIDNGVASGFKSKIDIGEYVQDLIDKVSNNQEFKQTITDLFSFDKSKLSPVETKTQIDAYINTISQYLDRDANELKISLGFTDVDELATKYENAVKFTKDKLGKTETKFFEENSINTEEEIDRWLEIAKACDLAVEAEQKYLNPESSNNNAVFTLTESQTKAIDDYQSKIKTLKTALDDLSNVDVLDLMQAFTDYDWSTFLDGGKSLQQVLNELADDSLQNVIQTVPELTDKFNELFNKTFDVQGQIDSVGKEYDNLLDVLNRLRNGQSLSKDETNKLIRLYPSLADKIEVVASGYKIEENALSSLINTSVKDYNTLITKSIEATRETIEQSKKRIEAYKIERKAHVKSVMDIADSKVRRETNLTYLSAAELGSYGQGALKGVLGDDLYKQYAEADDELTKINVEYKALNQAKRDLDDLLSSYKETTEDISSSKTNSTNDFNNSIDYTKQSIEVLSRVVDNLNDEFKNTDGYDKQISILKTLEKAQSSLADGYKKTAKVYENEYSKKIKGLTDGQISDITSGKSFKITDFSNEELFNKLSEAQELYNQWQDTLSSYNDIRQDIADTVQQQSDITFNKSVDDFAEKIKVIDDVLSEIDHSINFVDDDSIEQITLFQTGFDQTAKKAQMLNDEISSLAKAYKNGKITQDQYKQQLENLTSQLYSSTSAMNDYKNSITETMKARYSAEIEQLETAENDILDALNEQLDNQRKIVDEKKKALRLTEETYQYEKNVAKSNRRISDIQGKMSDREKAVASGDRKAIAEYKKLEEELAEEKEKLQEIQHDREIDLTEDELDQSLSMFEDNINKQIKATQDEYKLRIDSIKNLYNTEKNLIIEAANLTTSEFSNAYTKIKEIMSNSFITTSKDFEEAYTSSSKSTSKMSGVSSILAGADKTKSSDGLSGLNQYLVNRGYGVVSKPQMVSLAKALGVDGINSVDDVGTDAIGRKNKNAILEALKRAGFSNGGIASINTSSPSSKYLRSITGEDGIALVKNGEKLISDKQWSLISSMINMQPQIMKSLQYNERILKDFVPNGNSNNIDISGTMVNIEHVDKDVDYNALSNRIKDDVTSGILHAMNRK